MTTTINFHGGYVGVIQTEPTSTATVTQTVRPSNSQRIAALERALANSLTFKLTVEAHDELARLRALVALGVE